MLPGNQGLSMCNSCLRRQMSCPLSYLISFLWAFIVEMDALWDGIFLWSVRELSWLGGLLMPCPPRVYSLGSQSRKEKPLTLCKFCSSVAQTLLYYQHCFSHNFKASTVVKDIDSSQPEPVHQHFARLSLLSNTVPETNHKISSFSYTAVINLPSFLPTELIDSKFLAVVKKPEAEAMRTII